MKNILMFISGFLFASLIYVSATLLYNAKDIEYKDTNVESAINDLYSIKDDLDITSLSLNTCNDNLNSTKSTLNTCNNNLTSVTQALEEAKKLKRDFKMVLRISGTLVYAGGSATPTNPYGTTTKDITITCVNGNISIANNGETTGGIYSNKTWNSNYSTGVKLHAVTVVSFQYI